MEGYIGTNAGYLNRFSYSIHDSFYCKYCDLAVDVASYRDKGLTTRRAFVQILSEAKPRDQAKIIRGVFEMIPPPAGAIEDDAVQKKRALYKDLLEVAARLEADGQIDTPQIAVTSQVVLEALKDAEVLLNARGPTSALDRAHTALHGYLKKLCTDRGLSMPGDPSLTVIFKIIREQFPEFATVIIHDAEAKRMLGSVASALDTLNTIRNRATLAHPNELLLDAPEAMLYINLSRAVLAYIETKTRK
ncbi:MAG: abortive infection family protein [Candidatus Acidiferrales bacterium]